MTLAALTAGPNTLFDRFAKLNWGIITILIALAFVGVLMHFSGPYLRRLDRYAAHLTASASPCCW